MKEFVSEEEEKEGGVKERVRGEQVVDSERVRKKKKRETERARVQASE